MSFSACFISPIASFRTFWYRCSYPQLSAISAWTKYWLMAVSSAVRTSFNSSMTRLSEAFIAGSFRRGFRLTRRAPWSSTTRACSGWGSFRRTGDRESTGSSNDRDRSRARLDTSRRSPRDFRRRLRARARYPVHSIQHRRRQSSNESSRAPFRPIETESQSQIKPKLREVGLPDEFESGAARGRFGPFTPDSTAVVLARQEE